MLLFKNSLYHAQKHRATSRPAAPSVPYPVKSKFVTPRSGHEFERRKTFAVQGPLRFACKKPPRRVAFAWQMTLILIKDAPPLERIASPMARLHPRALKLTVLT